MNYLRLIVLFIGLMHLASSAASAQVNSDPCPFLGVMGADAPFSPSINSRSISSGVGALIISIIPSTEAERGGLIANDVIVSFGGERVRGISHLQRLVRSQSPGDTVSIEYVRNGTPLRLRVAIGVNPESDRPCRDLDWPTSQYHDFSNGETSAFIDVPDGRVFRVIPDGRGTSSSFYDLKVPNQMRFELDSSVYGSILQTDDSIRAGVVRLRESIHKLNADLTMFDTCRLAALSTGKNGDTIFTRLFRRYDVIDRRNSGVRVQSVPDQLAEYFRVPTTHTGLLVTEVDPTGPLGRSGLQAGDVVIELDGEFLASPVSFIERLQKGAAGERSMRVVRDGALLDLNFDIKLDSEERRLISEPPVLESRKSEIYAR